MVLILSGEHLQACGLFFSGGHSLHLRLNKLEAGVRPSRSDGGDGDG